MKVLMAKTKKKKKQNTELDSVYLLKLVLFLIIGAQWVRLTTASGTDVPLPIGLFIGVFFAVPEHFTIDRKIEYAVLLIAMLVGFFAQVGIFVTI